MPIYDYECKDCGAEVSDVFQKVTEPELKKCEACGTNGLYRVVTGGLHSFMAGSETIGSIVDKNNKKYKSQIQESNAKKQEENPAPEKPWYNKKGSKTKKEINKMNDSQKTRYIMEGR